MVRSRSLLGASLILTGLCSAAGLGRAGPLERPGLRAERDTAADIPVYLKDTDGGRPVLAVFGDSLATGVLANTQLGQKIEGGFWWQLLRVLLEGWIDPIHFQAVASNPELAAAESGAPFGLRSQLSRLAEAGEEPLGLVSLAKFGAQAVTLKPMLERLAALERAGAVPRPAFVFVMVGGNDFCSGHSPEEFGRAYRENVAAIARAYPDATFVVAPVPPVHRLAAIEYTYADGPADARGRLLSCRLLRSNNCPQIYDAGAGERLEAINRIIAETFALLPVPDGRKLFAGELTGWPIAREDLSVDCFHPSALGQEAIAHYLARALQDR